MEPLFENDLTVDAAVLEEWQRKELATRYRMVYFTYGALVLLCLVFVGTSVSIAVGMGMALAWALAGLLVAMLGVLLWYVLTLPRRLVKAALRRDKEAGIPYRSRALVYPDALQIQRNPPETDGRDSGAVAASLATAEVLQLELQQLAARAGSVTAEDTEELARLRGRLVEMKQQMEALSAGMPRAEAEYRFEWKDLSGYERTDNLHGLFFGEAVVLLSRGGFSKGNDNGFEALIKERLTEAAAALEQPKDRQRLEKELRRYWP